MKKLLIILILLSSVGCVNSEWQVPEQTDQEKTGNVNLIEYTF